MFADPLTGGPLSKRSLLKRYRRALAAAQLDTAHTFHHLRHTFGTRMAATGVPMRTLQEWMGHRNIETTQRYADYAPSAQEAVLVAAAFGATESSVLTTGTRSRDAGHAVDQLVTKWHKSAPRGIRPPVARVCAVDRPSCRSLPR